MEKYHDPSRATILDRLGMVVITVPPVFLLDSKVVVEVE